VSGLKAGQEVLVKALYHGTATNPRFATISIRGKCDTLGVPVEDVLHGETLKADLAQAQAERDRLHGLVNTPEIHDFLQAVNLEAAFQREKWGADGDAGKTDADWFWLIGYLAGKAIRPGASDEKRLHRIITVAAVCANWHLARLGKTDMRPGIAILDGAEK
jgi:hypothetical protein